MEKKEVEKTEEESRPAFWKGVGIILICFIIAAGIMQILGWLGAGWDMLIVSPAQRAEDAQRINRNFDKVDMALDGQDSNIYQQKNEIMDRICLKVKAPAILKANGIKLVSPLYDCPYDWQEKTSKGGSIFISN